MQTNEVLRDTDDHYVDVTIDRSKNTVTLFIDNIRFSEQTTVTMTVGEMHEFVFSLQEFLKE